MIGTRTMSELINRWFLKSIKFGMLDNDWHVFNGEEYLWIKDVFSEYVELDLMYDPKTEL